MPTMRRRPVVKPVQSPDELSAIPIMMLEGLYEEALGLPTDHEKVCIDDDAYKSWNHYVEVLRKSRLIYSPSRRAIMNGTAKPMRILDKGKAFYEQLRGTERHLQAKAWWESYVGELRAARARMDAALVKQHSR